jgi:drug/metabolite transporter (DMT)-like permease
MPVTNARAAHTLPYVALAAAGVLWGTGFLLGKWALAELGVGHMVLYRFVFACLGFAPVMWYHWRRHSPRVPIADVPIFLAAATLGVPVLYLVQYGGLALTTVAHASLMVGLLPVLQAAGAALFAHERLRLVGWIALVVSSGGAALIAFGGGSGDAGRGATLTGDALVAVSLIAAVAWVLLSQRLMRNGRRYSPVVTSAYVLAAGTVLLAAWVYLVDGPPPVELLPRTWLAVVAQGLITTTAPTLLWNWGLNRVAASRAGVFANLEPVVGTMLGVALLGDPLGARTVFGGLLIVGAAIVVTRE